MLAEAVAAECSPAPSKVFASATAGLDLSGLSILYDADTFLEGKHHLALGGDLAVSCKNLLLEEARLYPEEMTSDSRINIIRWLSKELAHPEQWTKESTAELQFCSPPRAEISARCALLETR
ncbi:hypothetical protein KP003_02760 [Geomonas nitrogeniifigens]|uniref:hypothetical protein n=1 Tax=Geomonas diazotrophica TaxID=2843197 RepID=UPI001C2C0780|nr:hypothetical protein [Geomonas nitrogeniifigens]QXE87345.1 hypothetical protein KP003_02760 [Geomonas nitrogeniifigens]